MSSKLANFISVIFHPFFLTLYSFILVFTSGSYIAFLPNSIKLVILIVVVFNTLLIPLISLFIFKKLKIISSYHLQNNRERIFPIIITIIPYVFTLYLVAKLPVPYILVRIVMASILLLIFGAIVSIWWKISLHLIGIGGLTGFLIACAYLDFFNSLPLIVASIIVSGLLASARLKNGDHSPSQVYVGFIAAFCLVFALFLV